MTAVFLVFCSSLRRQGATYEDPSDGRRPTAVLAVGNSTGELETLGIENKEG